MLRKCILLLLVYAFQFILSNELSASEDYVVKNVQVDVTGHSASEARTKAMADAQRQAYKSLLERMLLQNDTPLMNLTDEQLDYLVQSIEIQSEKNSNVRYLGTLTIRFNPQAVQEWLAQQDKKIASLPANKATVIIPLMVRGEKILLWEESNPWWQAWNQKTELGNEDLIVPMGDLQDMQSLSTKEALEGSIISIRKLLSRYNANRAIIATFYEGPISRLEARHYSSEGLVESTAPFEFDATIYAPATLLPAAMNKILEASTSTSLNKPLSYEPKTINFIIKFRNYSEWLMLQKHIESLQGTKQVFIHRLNCEQAQVSLTCLSSEAFIEDQLKAKGIILEPKSAVHSQRILSLAHSESNPL